MSRSRVALCDLLLSADAGPGSRILEEYLTVRDLPALDIALCNHSPRPQYLAVLRGKCFFNSLQYLSYRGFLIWMQDRGLSVTALSLHVPRWYNREALIRESMFDNNKLTQLRLNDSIIDSTVLSVLESFPSLLDLHFDDCEWDDVSLIGALLDNFRSLKTMSFDGCYGVNVSHLRATYPHIEFIFSEVIDSESDEESDETYFRREYYYYSDTTEYTDYNDYSSWEPNND